jgi:hypothetical protein
MRSDGKALPDLAEAVVLHQLDLVSSDQLPGLAARWLALDVVDTESIRRLAGENSRGRWTIEQLLVESVSEADVAVPSDGAEAQRIAVDWVTTMWRESKDTRWAVGTLASLGERNLDFDLGFFIGLNDEWHGGWGRSQPDLWAEAEGELRRLLGDDSNM